ncbi:hypothetical protein [Xenorhabdus koppenhoeferi]|uniref:Uncharacterized protein n=1 Tax=Xenorhabdus koppenhoeferi TaxID=351659 RepID=A0A1I7K851_9GAMM|nr:hypothetical protein [Xenorhabdus koppenhoeferi]SFU93633.1 hypothetical protein SAMN05421784_14914 [Xenorhabdus koppenhoeferi]
MIFTDLPAAIEEARYRRRETDRHFAVVQRDIGMSVLTERWVMRKCMRMMYSTRRDRVHTVLPGIK